MAKDFNLKWYEIECVENPGKSFRKPLLIKKNTEKLGTKPAILTCDICKGRHEVPIEGRIYEKADDYFIRRVIEETQKDDKMQT